MSDTHIIAADTLEQRRDRMRLQTEQRKEEIYSKFPRIKEIDEKVFTLGLERAEYTLWNRQAEANRIADKQNELINEKKSLLTAGGYPADYTDRKYVCAKCKDTGFSDGSVCTCVVEDLLKTKQQKMAEASPFPDCRFENFSLDYYDEKPIEGTVMTYRGQMKAILKFCTDYAENFGKSSRSLMLFGHSGLGKTHLACSIANAVIEKGYTVLYASSQNLFYQFEQSKYDENNMLYDILDCDLFILDDLGAENMTNYTQSILYNIVNTRMINRKPTIYTTNLATEKQIQMRYSEKTSSRLLGECTILSFVGEDIRIKKRYGKKQ